MTVTCPCCLRKVLPKSDNHCPSCGGVIEENGAEILHELLTIKKGQQLPKICFHCGRAATSFTMVKIEGAQQEHKAIGQFILKRLFPGLMRGVSNMDSFRVDLPSCENCTDMEEFRFLLGSNIVSRTINIAAHKDFAAAFQELINLRM